MYSTCLFCTQPLGANEVVEHFPVGRRIAFDAAKGRLWVVCRSCARWNLTPLEERWEAIEEAERLFRDTRLRVSTDNIGLAKLSEGLELVRVGKPQRPEIAAWRYGDQFGRRRRRGFVTAGLIAAGGGTVLAGGAALGMGVISGAQLARLAWRYAEHGLPMETVARFRLGHGTLIKVQRRHLRATSFRVGADGSLGLDLEHSVGELRLDGAEARRVASMILPSVSRLGGTRDEIQQAVERLERAGDAERYLTQAARHGQRISRHARTLMREQPNDYETGMLALSTPFTLALEMALHEEQERRALEGELAELEAAWRDAEEIGAIADSLLLPEWVESVIRRMKGEG
ncbi:MAG TPA: hypothetical protein VF034_12275 [Gemmatimonadaceae bacterium]